MSIKEQDWTLSQRGLKDAARHREKIKESIRENIADIISDEAIITKKRGKIIKVPVRGIKSYRFIYGGDRGSPAGVGQGKGKKGDIIPRPSIDENAATQPDGWKGWPDNKKFALIIMHDVDTLKGHDNCYQLMKLEQELGFRSIFYFVPERYTVSEKLRNDLTNNSFEVGVHGLKHDGRLFSSENIFQKRALKINHYLNEWNAKGFSSPAMHHQLEWMHALDIEYATTTFDTDPFEPQPEGVHTIFPFIVNKGAENKKGPVELPYTIAQDFTLFILMQEKNIDIWKKKLDWIAEKGGMALVNSHPDYMNFDRKKTGPYEYPAEYYREFLEYILNNYKDTYWHDLPSEMASFWKSKMGKE